MSKRIDPTWIVVASIENGAHDRCVDLFLRPDGSYGFEEFRRDVEDARRMDAGGDFSPTPPGISTRAAHGRRDPRGAMAGGLSPPAAQ